MASLNKVILIGRLGKDPEITTFDNGNRKISATLVTSERYRDRENNWVEQTDWHNIVVWGNLANDIAEGRRNYAKGDLMYVEGKLRTRQYTDQQGIIRYITEVHADKMMQMAPARPVQQSSYGQPYTPAPEPTPGYVPQNNPGAPEEGNDLPFWINTWITKSHFFFIFNTNYHEWFTNYLKLHLWNKLCQIIDNSCFTEKNNWHEN